jgi:hypothetical protein
MRALSSSRFRQNEAARVRGGMRQRLGHAVPLAAAISETRRVHQAGRGLCETANRRPMRLTEPVTAEPVTCVRCLDRTGKVRSAGTTARTTGSTLIEGSQTKPAPAPADVAPGPLLQSPLFDPQES